MNLIGIVDVIEEGFRVYVRNPMLFLPYLLSGLASAATFLVLSAILLYSYLSSAAFFQSSSFALLTFFALACAFVGILMVGWLILPGIFQAAAIQMADAALKGEHLKPEMAYGPDISRASRLIVSNVAIMAISLFVSFFLLFANALANVDLHFVLVFFFGMAFMFYPFGIVISGKGIKESIVEGWVIFRKNMVFVGLLFIFMNSVLGFFQLISAIFITAFFGGVMTIAHSLTGSAPNAILGFASAAVFIISIFFISVFSAPIRTVCEAHAYGRLKSEEG